MVVSGSGGGGAGVEGWGVAGATGCRGHEGPGDQRKRLFPEISQQISLQTSTGVRALKELAPLSRVFPPPKDLAAFWGTLSL